MEIIAVLILIPLMTGAGLCRWTGLQPLWCGAIVWVIAAAAIMLILAGFLVTDVWIPAAISALFPASAAALGGFLGWLRRTHLKRIN